MSMLSNVINIDINDIYENSENINIHTEESIRQIERSIREYGFINPIIIDENNIILAGHGRLLAARKIGLSKVPVIVAKGLSEDQKTAFGIVDNAIADFSYFDLEKLEKLIEELQNKDYDIESLCLRDIYTEKWSSDIQEKIKNELEAEVITIECNESDKERLKDALKAFCMEDFDAKLL